MTDNHDRLGAEMIRRGAVGQSESLDDALRRMLRALASKDRSYTSPRDNLFESELEQYVVDRTLAFSTMIMANAGDEAKPSASCTVLPITVDSDGQIEIPSFRRQARLAFEDGIGVGYDVEHLRDFRSGLKSIDAQFAAINAPLVSDNRRPVASMLTLRADHPGVEEFVAEVSRADRQSLATASLVVTETLFRNARSDGEWHLRNRDDSISATISARNFVHQIAEAIHRSGNPGVVFLDRFNHDNPLPSSPYVTTAPCAEVGMAIGDACHFAYVNLVNLSRGGDFDWSEFDRVVRIGVRALDAAVDLTIAAADTRYPLVKLKRRIGISITGLSDCLDLLDMEYNSDAARAFAVTLSERLAFTSKTESAHLARERGPFPLFGTSRYREPEWVRRKLPGYILGEAEWEALFTTIESHGLRHATTTAMSSAETASALLEVSTSLEPNMHPSRSGDGSAGSYPIDEVPALVSVPAAAQLQMQGALQRYLDDAISKTVNLPANATEADIVEVLHSASDLGLKGVAAYRVMNVH